MAMFEVLKSAYAIGGASAVLVTVLIGAIVVLWRKLQTEHDERLTQARKDTELLRDLLEISISSNARTSRHGEELLDYDGDEVSTRVTFQLRDNVHRRARDYIESVRPTR
jgi:hypothetical protein